MLPREKECENALSEELLEVDISEESKNHLELNRPIDSVTLFPQAITYQSKQVTQITLIGYFLNQRATEDELSATRVILQFNDGSYKLLRFKESTLDTQLIMYYLFQFTNGICENAFHQYGDREYGKEYWAIRAANPTLSYTPQERDFYTNTHVAMANTLLQNIKYCPMSLEKAKKGICIISLCCGRGNEMQTCYDIFREAGFKNCTAIGIDSCKLVIDENKRAKDPHSYIQADIINIADTLNLLINSRMLNVDGRLVVFTASGAFGRGVINGTCEALDIMQQIAATNICHFLVAGNFTNMLLTNDSVVAAGWNMTAQNYCGKSNDKDDELVYQQLYVCKRQSVNKQFSIMLNRSKIRGKDPKTISTLDLSFTSNPLLQLSNFYFKKPELVSVVTQVDLAWSHIPKDRLSDLFSIFEEFSELKYVTISGCEKWSKDFTEQLRKNMLSFSLLQRLDSTNPHELPTIPVYLCKQMGIYSTLPNKIILKGKANFKKQIELTDTTSVVKESGKSNVTVDLTTSSPTIARR